MGEAKHRDSRRSEYERLIVALSRKLTDDGKLIEAGWAGLRGMALPEDAPALQVAEMRKAFMAGAQHLFSSLITIMDEDREPTAADLRRMDLINRELEAFGQELARDAYPTKGNA